MKKIILMLFAAATLTACINDYDTEDTSVEVFTAQNIGEQNTTIADLRTKYASAINSSSYKRVSEDLIIEGIVTGNDINGNIYQYIVLQDITDDGKSDTTHGGIQLAIKGIGSLAAVFPVGQRVRVNLNGLYVGAYGKCPRIGQPYVNTNGALRQGPMTIDKVKTNVMLVGKADPNNVVPREITKNDITTSNLDLLCPMFVKMTGAEIPDAKLTDNQEKCKFAHTDDPNNTYTMEHKIKLSDGGTLSSLNTSTSATFANEDMPQGKLTIQGILSRYTNNWQMTLREVYAPDFKKGDIVKE